MMIMLLFWSLLLENGLMLLCGTQPLVNNYDIHALTNSAFAHKNLQILVTRLTKR